MFFRNQNGGWGHMKYQHWGFFQCQLLLFLHRAKLNTCLSLSLSRPCYCMQFSSNRLVCTTEITKKRGLVALLMYFAFTWSSLKNEKSPSNVHLCSNTLYIYVYLIVHCTETKSYKTAFRAAHSF